jgi:hypothetical protein
MPLNGASANTEGGRLERLMRSGRMCYRGDGVSTVLAPCREKVSVQVPITPTSDSRTNTLTATINGTQLNGGGITQERVRQLLATLAVRSGMPESVRIAELQEKTIACSDDSPTLRPIIIPACPPLPPPPGPPAPICVLSKSQKF